MRINNNKLKLEHLQNTRSSLKYNSYEYKLIWLLVHNNITNNNIL